MGDLTMSWNSLLINDDHSYSWLQELSSISVIIYPRNVEEPDRFPLHNLSIDNPLLKNKTFCQVCRKFIPGIARRFIRPSLPCHWRIFLLRF